MSSSEALKIFEQSSSVLSMGLGSSFRTDAGSVSTSSGGSNLGMGSPLSVCVTSLTGLFSADVLRVFLETEGDFRLELGEPSSF